MFIKYINQSILLIYFLIQGEISHISITVTA